MDRFLTKAQLHALLKDRGHTLWSDESEKAPTDVGPKPETIITVGSNLDPTLMEAYRQRYFACYCSSRDDHTPLLLHAPEFALPEPFATIAEREPGNSYFMDGPVRWLLARVKRFEQVLLWRPLEGFGVEDEWTGAEGSDDVLHLAPWFERHALDASDVAAVLLCLSDLEDCNVVWTAANLVGEDCYDFFLGDSSGREVYKLHHHDKVVISIPDTGEHNALLEELARYDELLEDCSNYRLKGDDSFHE